MNWWAALVGTDCTRLTSGAGTWSSWVSWRLWAACNEILPLLPMPAAALVLLLDAWLACRLLRRLCSIARVLGWMPTLCSMPAVIRAALRLGVLLVDGCSIAAPPSLLAAWLAACQHVPAGLLLVRIVPGASCACDDDADVHWLVDPAANGWP
jgi:hypothetical protein